LENPRTLDGSRPLIYEVEVDGTPLTVNLMPDGTLTIGDHTFRLDVLEIQGLSLYSLLLDNASYEVVVDEKDDICYALVRGKVHRIQVSGGTAPAALRRGGASPLGDAVIHAPLSGLIVDIPVMDGQNVDENQIVLILESMKMENEIRTPRAGTVRDVKVKAGGVVRDGDPLLTVC
jgi:biotin carboxyl carrier protein